MSLPKFSSQASFLSLTASPDLLFGPTDRYRLFAQKIYPLIASTRPELEELYCKDNGRRGIEPVLMMGVSLLQYLEGMPDRQAIDCLRYHAGWNFALNRSMDAEGFHPSSLVYFRQRLTEKDQSRLLFGRVLEGLIEAGLVARKSKLDYQASTESLQAKRKESGADAAGLLEWVGILSDKRIGQGKQVLLLKRVFEEHYEVVAGQGIEHRKDSASDRV